MLQHHQLQNEETSVRCKSSTGNLFHSPMGVTDNSEQDYTTKSPTVTNATDINTVEGMYYCDTTIYLFVLTRQRVGSFISELRKPILFTLG